MQCGHPFTRVLQNERLRENKQLLALPAAAAAAVTIFNDKSQTTSSTRQLEL